MRKILSTLLLLCLSLSLFSVCLPALAENTEESTDDTGVLSAFGSGVSVMAKENLLLKSALPGKDVTFDVMDFKKALGVNRIESITVTALPDAKDGVLRLSNLRVSEGQTVKAENLSLLRFTPAGEMTEEASFRFTCEGYAGDAEITCLMRIAEGINRAPVALSADESLSVMTLKSVTVYGKMEGSDADGDALTYHIVKYPEKGVLTDTDKESGEFCYTPFYGYTGKDSFTYVVQDARGSYSDVATVHIHVKRLESELVLSDMADNRAHTAALILTDMGIMEGEHYNGTISFNPQNEVTREEFTVMLLRAAGVKTRGYTATSFEDNADIAEENRAAIATAHVLGYVNGSLTDDGLVFRPKDTVTAAEAATLLCRAFQIELPDSVATFAPEAEVPVWAAPAMTALSEAGVFSLAVGESADMPLSRGTVADLLYKAIKTVE